MWGDEEMLQEFAEARDAVEGLVQEYTAAEGANYLE